MGKKSDAWQSFSVTSGPCHITVGNWRRTPSRSVFADNMFSCCCREREDRNGTALGRDGVFSPLGWLAGLVTRLNRHGYFISRPPEARRPHARPQKAQKRWAEGGPQAAARGSQRRLLCRRRFCRFAVRTRSRIKSSGPGPPYFSLNC